MLLFINCRLDNKRDAFINPDVIILEKHVIYFCVGCQWKQVQQQQWMKMFSV